MSRVARVALAVLPVAASMLVATSSANASPPYNKNNPDGHLEVINYQTCTQDDPGDSNAASYCGIYLYGRTDVWEDDENGGYPDCTVKLVDLKTEATVKHPSCYASGGFGSSFEEPNYYGSGFEVGPFKSLPNGKYILSYKTSTPGYWTCSIYDPNGCSWNPAVHDSGSYYVDWSNTTQRNIFKAAKPSAPKVTGQGYTHKVVVRWASPLRTGNAPLKGYSVVVRTKSKTYRANFGPLRHVWTLPMPKHSSAHVTVTARNAVYAGQAASKTIRNY